jgi:iron complex transport system ATP-binding protein
MIAGPEGPLGLEHLTVRYGDRVALRDVSLRVEPGEVVALAGPNGSGKSSLIRAVAMSPPGTSGAARLGGQELGALSVPARARLLGWMPQEEPLGDNVALSDYVGYGRYAHVDRWTGPSSRDLTAVADAIAEVDLGGYEERGLLELSGGERQRARLARVLAQDTPGLLLDEPTAHLDIGHQLDVLQRVRAHARRRRRAVVIAIHDLNLAARFADRVAVLAQGQLRTVGTPEQVLSPELLAEVWGVIAEIRRDPASGLPYLIPRLPPTGGPLTAPTAGRRPRVHLVAGGGSGAALMRSMLEHGYQVSAGVLPLFDSDSELARELGIPTAVELPFAPIGPEALARQDELLELAEAVVVAPFPVGPSNLENLEHLAGWAARRPILLVDPPTDARWDFTGGRATAARDRLVAAGARRTADPSHALDWLSARTGRAPPG